MSKYRHIADHEWKRPTTFREHYEQFPEMHETFVQTRWHVTNPNDREDLEQHLLIETMRKKIVENYDPAKQGGTDNVKLYFAYLYFMWKRMCYSFMHLQNKKSQGGDAMLYALSIEDLPHTNERQSEGSGQSNDNPADYILGATPEHRGKQASFEKQLFARLSVERLRLAVQRQYPQHVNELDRWLRGEKSDPNKNHVRLMIRRMARGEKMPAPRKPYKRRIKKP